MRLSYAGNVLLALLLLSGCSIGASRPSLGDRLDPGWKPGVRWSVDVTAWPQRARDSYTESSRRTRSQWVYEVLESPKDDRGYRVRVSNDTTSYLLDFDEAPNLRFVREVLDRTDDAIKTRTLHASPTGGGPFLLKNWQPSQPVYFLHPDMTSTDAFSRTNFTSGGRSTREWMTQRVRGKDPLRIVLEHEPSRTRAVLRWNPGEPWWTEARYYYRERLILRAQR